MLHRFTDIHTHVAAGPQSILSIPVSGVERLVLRPAGQTAAAQPSPAMRLPDDGLPPQPYSLQLHPWHLTSGADIDAFTTMAQRLAADPALVAIGECGLDGLCQTPLALQHEAFLAALRTARALRRPVIVHCVRLWGEMLRDVHTVFPELRRDAEAWREWTVIVHGFRRGPQLAQQLLDAGLQLSLGTKYHPDVAKMLPAERCYHETDEE